MLGIVVDGYAPLGVVVALVLGIDALTPRTRFQLLLAHGTIVQETASAWEQNFYRRLEKKGTRKINGS